MSSSTSFLSLLLAVVTWVYFWVVNSQKSKEVYLEDGLLDPPTPRKLPIIGHLHLLGGYEVPYQAFSAMGLKYGKVIRLQLGNVKCVVVNGQKNIREALVTKGHHFDSRPSFQRYQQLFSGNKQNCKYKLILFFMCFVCLFHFILGKFVHFWKFILGEGYIRNMGLFMIYLSNFCSDQISTQRNH